MGERHVCLADDVILKLDADDLPDEAALAQALTHPAHEQWTGVQVRHDEPATHLDLWLATITSGLRCGRLTIGTAARALGLADPAVRWAGASLYDAGTIAYLATRPTSDEANELGIITHGPDSSKLAHQVHELLHRGVWGPSGRRRVTSVGQVAENLAGCPASQPAADSGYDGTFRWGITRRAPVVSDVG